MLNFMMLAAGQGTGSEGGWENTSLEILNLTSISGIIIATMLIVEILKRALRSVPVVAKVPVFIYSGVISMVLAYIANHVKTDDGSPYLEGNSLRVIWAALVGALGASGFYTWLRTPESLEQSSPMGTATVKTSELILLPLCLSIVLGLGSGCNAIRSNVTPVEQEALLNGLVDGSRTIRQQHKEWAGMMVEGNDQRMNLPLLTAAQKAQIDATHADYDALVAEEKARIEERKHPTPTSD